MNKNTRISYNQTINTAAGEKVIVRQGTFTGEMSEAGLFRIEWDEDGYGRMGWVEPGTFTVSHRRAVYMDDKDKGTYAYSCPCGLRDGDYLCKEYAIDGWREAHDLEPLTNYPLV